MVERVREHFTIVVAGKWNIGIFSPEWLRQHVLEAQEISVEVGVEPGTPRRITGDRVVMIPTSAQLVVSPAELQNAVLERSDQIVCRLLELLPHTPASAVGLNFGYREVDPSDEILEKLPSLFAEEFAANNLALTEKSFRWSLNLENRALNLTCDVSQGSLFFKFNYHSAAPDANAAIALLANQFVNHMQISEDLLDKIFDLQIEALE